MDYTPSRLGQINATGDDDALFLKVWSGEILTAFDTRNVFQQQHLTRNITSGKSASFPATWKANASYHVPGNELTGSNQIKKNERVINIDDLLVADVFIANIDEAKNHYDVRAIYTHQLGEALAKAYDQKVSQVIVLAARASATINGAYGGGEVVHANAKTDGERLASMFFDAAQALDEKDIPDTDRFGNVKPAQYYLLAQTTKILNKDWGGAGSYSMADVPPIGGIQIIKTNNLASTDLSGASTVGHSNTYNGNFSNVAATVHHMSAVGTVKLMELSSESEYQVSRQGTLFVAKYALGHGILRPEAAVQLVTSSNAQ